MWNSPLVTKPSVNRMTHSGRIIKTPDRLTHAPAVELRYLGEMADLDNAELLLRTWHYEAWNWP